MDGARLFMGYATRDGVDLVVNDDECGGLGSEREKYRCDVYFSTCSHFIGAIDWSTSFMVPVRLALIGSNYLFVVNKSFVVKLRDLRSYSATKSFSI